LVRLLEIIGEAASRIAPEIVPTMLESMAADYRHEKSASFHGYDLVDFEILGRRWWRTSHRS